MFRKFIVIAMLVILLLTGCGVSAPTPISEPTMMPPTETMEPTKTPIPPTFTATQTSTMTKTVTPLPTDTPLPSITPTNTALATPNLFYGSSGYEKRDNWATLKLENNTGQDISAKIGGPGFYTYLTFRIDTVIEVPWGDFWYEVYIGENGPFNGGFSVTNSDKHTLVFEGNKIRFLVP